MTRIFANFTQGLGNFGPLANNLLGLGGQAFGASLFGKGGFAQGGAFAKGGLLGGLGPDILSSAAVGLAGFVLSKVFGGETALKIEQPVDIRIVDIETRLANFFNFRNVNPFVYSNQFKQAYEDGVF